MEKIEVSEFTQKLIEKAESGKHTKVDLIRNLFEFRVALEMRTAEAKVVHGLQLGAKALYNTYIDKLKEGVDDLQFLVNHKLLLSYAEYYEEEYNIVNNAIKEFLIYMFGGGAFIDMLFGYDRDESELLDYRTGEWIGGIENGK